MAKRGEVLVAIIPTKSDMKIAREQYWYRIPIDQVERLKQRDVWEPKWLAFYQPKVFGDEAFAINYYASIKSIRQVFRYELFPDESQNPKSQKRYYKIDIQSMEKLPQPIYSRRLRRILFISTTWEKLINAVEINDLWDESPLEDKLWAELKRYSIDAERQHEEKVKNKTYLLDFAIYCENGKIDAETDGDTWHSVRERIAEDNLRDNDLETVGWRTIRFNSQHVKEEMTEYCIPTILENIKNLGGLKDDKKRMPRKIGLDGSEQLSLF
jgi:very-short-patch-repair endonuclease